jgi:hypothetical protein
VSVRFLTEKHSRAEISEKKLQEALDTAHKALGDAKAANAANPVKLASIRADLEAARVRQAEESAAAVSQELGHLAAFESVFKILASLAGHPFAAEYQARGPAYGRSSSQDHGRGRPHR